MKFLLKVSLILTFPLTVLASWENPNVVCPEDAFPKGVTCPDLTTVRDPLLEFPSEMTPEERQEWTRVYPVDLKVCRHQEVLRREKERPGSFTPLQIQIAWMTTQGGLEAAEKLTAVMSASKKHTIPPHVLIGAITQESLLSSLGISPDGENFSCGIAQLNVQEWCQSLATLTPAERERMKWPAIACGDLSPVMVKPFFEIARTRIGARPEYQINSGDFKGITLSQVIAGLPPGDQALQESRFKAITSFIQNCQDVSVSISLKGHTLKTLFQRYVPSKIRNDEMYDAGTTFGRSCREPYPSKYYPLHTGWLLAVAMYNAGPVQIKLIEHYYRVQNSAYPELNPLDLIDALHWGGSARAGSTRIHFSGQDGKAYSQSWYKSCVVQRHVARVVQHVTRPNYVIARSIEQVPCARDSVPTYRRKSSGYKL